MIGAKLKNKLERLGIDPVELTSKVADLVAKDPDLNTEQRLSGLPIEVALEQMNVTADGKSHFTFSMPATRMMDTKITQLRLNDSPVTNLRVKKSRHNRIVTFDVSGSITNRESRDAVGKLTGTFANNAKFTVFGSLSGAKKSNW